MKGIAYGIAALFIAASFIPVNAQSLTSKIQEIENDYTILQTSIDSLTAVTGSLLSAASENAGTISELKDALEAYRETNQDKVRTFRRYSDVIQGWVMLLIFSIFLPLLLVFLYLRHADEQKRRYDIIVDLIRSGVDIKPELQDYLTGANKQSKVLDKGPFSGMNQSDLDYCSKRLMYGAFTILVGIIISSAINDGRPFLVMGCVGIFFIAQAIVRFCSVRYYNQNSGKEDNRDAQ